MSADYDALIQQTRELSDRMVSMRDGLAETEVTGYASDGSVAVTMTVTGDFRSVRIENELFRKGRDEVEVGVLDALRDAAVRLQAVTDERVSGLQEMFKGWGA